MLNTTLKIPIEKLYPILIYNFVTGQVPSKATFEDRLLWQKVGYIAQQLGASLDEYTFNWYKAGPYSSGYTSLLYDIPNTIEDAFDYSLSKSVQKRLEPMKIIIENVPSGMSIPKWFELMASILYIKRDTGLDKKSVMISLTRKKPFFSDENINNFAWDLLKKLDML